MIYKCKDCGKEYNNKPEFCDCGNNFFEIIKEQEDNIVKPVKTIQHHKVNSDIHKENKPQINYKLINSIIAILIFTIILLICFSLKKTEVQQPEKESQKDVVKTEDVNNTPKKEIEIYIEEPKIKTEAKQPAANQQETVKRQEKTNEISKASKDNNKQQKNQTTTNPKTTKKQIQEQKTVKPEPQQPKNQQQQSNQKVQAPLPSKKQEVKNPPVQIPSIVPKPAATVDKTAEKKELQQYKNALRNKISSDIDFTKVIGDGQCSITFKVNPSGVLTNRAFSHQSENDSLNDAVYSAVMNNPAYNPPPSGYKNEVMKLTVKIYGGRFEVNLN